MRNFFKKNNKNLGQKEMNTKIIIGIWGSFGSGKTTLSIKLAKYLSNLKKNTILVFDDILCPTIPAIVENLKKQEENSLGNILIGSIDQETIKENLVTMDNKYLGLLGYKKGDNFTTYPGYESEFVEDLLLQLRQIADFIVVDLSSYIQNNTLTDTVLKRGDKIITLTTADYKGLSYFNSTLPLMLREEYNITEHINIVSNVKDYQDKETINRILKGKEIYLHNTEEITDQEIDKKLFDNLVTKESKLYNENFNKLMELILYG